MKLAVAVACNKGGSSSNSIIRSNSKNDNVIDTSVKSGDAQETPKTGRNIRTIAE